MPDLVVISMDSFLVVCVLGLIGLIAALYTVSLKFSYRANRNNSQNTKIINNITNHNYYGNYDKNSESHKRLMGKTMFQMTHNYQLGLAVLVFSFIFFYLPIIYAFLAIKRQHRRKKWQKKNLCGNRSSFDFRKLIKTNFRKVSANTD